MKDVRLRGLRKRYLPAVTAKRLGKCPNCGTDFIFTPKPKSKKTNRFAALSVEGYTMILYLAGVLESGGEIEEPSKPKPTGPIMKVLAL